jgi:uncharacterized protein (TIGR02391 family)
MSFQTYYPEYQISKVLEPQELGLSLLKHLNSLSPNQVHRFNFLNTNNPDLITWSGGRAEANSFLMKLSISWSWLERELMLCPSPRGQNLYFISELGSEILTTDNVESYRKGHLLSSDGLDPVLIREVRPTYIRGSYDTAIFQAFKEVEVRLRNKAELADSFIGVKLAIKAFKPEGGILTDNGMEGGEKEARMALFSGTIGSFKNPTSHRYVGITDPHLVADIIRLANILLKIIDSTEKNIE